MEYRGIQLHESVKLYLKDGKVNLRCKEGLDKLADTLMEKNHVLISEFIHTKEKILIDFNCGHDPHWIAPSSYKRGRGCPKCISSSPILAKENLLNLINENGHELLSEYVNDSTKVLIDFKCVHGPYMIRPNSYKQGSGCKRCGASRATEWSRIQAKEDLLKLIKDSSHELLSEYVNSMTKVQIDFNCGHIPHWITPNDYKSGYGCPKCAGLCPIQAEEEFKQLLEQNGHKLLNDYVNAQTKVLVDFNCGHEPHPIKPFMYKQKHKQEQEHGCPKCNGKCPIQAKEKFCEKVEKAGFKLLGEYINSNTKVEVECDSGHVIDILPLNLTYEGYRCPKCAGFCPVQAKEELLELIKENGHELLSEYKNSNSKVQIDFKCGHDPHWYKPFQYKQGHRCPTCREPKGERIIREYLDAKGISHKSQYKFPNDNREYDFYLPLENAIVEVHGQQHYEEVEFFRLSLEEEQLNDKQKKEYAELFGCKYIEIDYREGKPKLALERFIKAYEQIKL